MRRRITGKLATGILRGKRLLLLHKAGDRRRRREGVGVVLLALVVDGLLLVALAMTRVRQLVVAGSLQGRPRARGRTLIKRVTKTVRTQGKMRRYLKTG
jgi:hypothetical protein